MGWLVRGAKAESLSSTGGAPTAASMVFAALPAEALHTRMPQTPVLMMVPDACHCWSCLCHAACNSRVMGKPAAAVLQAARAGWGVRGQVLRHAAGHALGAGCNSGRLHLLHHVSRHRLHHSSHSCALRGQSICRLCTRPLVRRRALDVMTWTDCCWLSSYLSDISYPRTRAAEQDAAGGMCRAQTMCRPYSMADLALQAS